MRIGKPQNAGLKTVDPIPSDAVRGYITAMLGDLRALAQGTGHEDLLLLLIEAEQMAMRSEQGSRLEN